MPRFLPGFAFAAVVCAIAGVSGGCLARPVVSSDPVTHTNFGSAIPQGSIDKVDLLFDIDNSASMGDKQAYLAQAIPDLVARLVTPNCVDAEGAPTGTQATIDGTCPADSAPEFPPVHDMHIGIVSSSLGQRLGDVCPTDPSNAASYEPLPDGGMQLADNDDKGRLIDRAVVDPTNLHDYAATPLGAAEPDQFLDWFPNTVANANTRPTGPTPVTEAADLQIDFQKMVVGVHQFGCGIESQLESWYRFLVQPDPYSTLGFDASKKFAQWQGVDNVLLAQRAEFLRPDSLVVVLVLTDENDSEVDVRSLGGEGWKFMVSSTDKFQPPHGTAACQSGDPAMVASDACTSCAFGKTPNDPQCKANGGVYNAANDWGYSPNLRHVHEREKYGLSVQFPIERYVLGLTSTKVPNRDGEYPPAKTASGYASSYQGLVPAGQTCTNPLFAAKLPAPPAGLKPDELTPAWADQLCHLAPGTRQQKMIFYAHIGGVPHQLLQADPSMPDSAQKDVLTDDDWTLILGKDPEHFDYSGTDPHMIESYQSRTSAPRPQHGFKVADASQAEGTDPISGREWVTDSVPPHPGIDVDREYACTFKLTDRQGNPTPYQCDPASVAADPTLGGTCDCQPRSDGTPYTQAQLPAVCNDKKQTQQDYAKAYPTIRELLLARLLGKVPGANPGIVSSLCPIHTTDMSTPTQPDRLYGYRPAMDAIATRLGVTLGVQCLPQRLDVTTDPATHAEGVACLVLGTFPDGPDAPKDCASVAGYRAPDPTVLAHVKTDQHDAWMALGDPTAVDASKELTCQLDQLPPDQRCDKQSAAQGWCYIDDGSVRGCPQVLLFSPNALQLGVQTSLQCLEASSGNAGP